MAWDPGTQSGGAQAAVDPCMSLHVDGVTKETSGRLVGSNDVSGRT
jgi:hypothetical protein